MGINTPREIITTQIATHNAASPVGAEIMTNMQGRSKTTSEGVQVSTNPSDLTDALEELGMAAATRGKKDLETMKARKGAGTDMDALSRIADYYDKLPNMPSDQKGRDLVRSLEQYQEEMLRNERGEGSGKNPKAEDIRKALQEYDGDITHQFAAIEDMRKRFVAANADPAFIALIDEVRAEMREPETAQEIMAGFYSAKEASSLADRFATDPQSFRDSYRDMVRSGGDLGRVFTALGEFLQTGVSDETKFDDIIDSFIKVAGDDMKSFGPSTDKAILGDVIAELKTLKNMKTALSMTQGMTAKLASIFPDMKDRLPSSSDITASLLSFASSKVPSAMDAEAMLRPFSDLDPEVAVVALNVLRDMHNSLPDSVIPGDTARLQQSKILLNLSDTFVSVEETSFASKS